MSKSRGPEFDATMTFVKATLAIGVLAAAVAVGIRIGREYPTPPEEVVEPDSTRSDERIYAPELQRRSPGTARPNAEEEPAQPVSPEARAAEPVDEPVEAPARVERTLERVPAVGGASGEALPEGVAVERTIVREVEPAPAQAPDPAAVQREIVVVPQ
jgi:hypothetical protein